VEIIRSGECGNSPKNAFVEAFIIALIGGKVPPEMLSDDADLPSSPWSTASALRISHAISHGRVGAGNGVVTEGGKTLGFAVVLEFANTKGDRVRSRVRSARLYRDG